MTRRLALAALGTAALAGGFFAWRGNAGAKRAEELYAQPLTSPEGPLRTYHLGHSLVGRNMPAMLTQLLGEGAAHHSQLGWGTPLRSHWEPEVEIMGFDTENAHPRHRPAREALESGDYEAVFFTEMVEIKDAIRYHDSPKYLARWADLAHAANPEARLYLYETWHHIDDPADWQTRLTEDFEAQWQARLLHPALARTEAPLYLIPGGQVMGAYVQAAEAAGLGQIEDIFGRNEDGSVDTIHFNDLGAYLIALTHYAVLTHRDPTGLPHQLLRADGTPADAPTAEQAALMQEVTWHTVTALPQTGVAA